jgi:hypothetical protein
MQTLADDRRAALLRKWLERLDPGLALRPATMRPASADASFRRYFRLDAGDEGQTAIAVDAPPEHEDSAMFIAIANWLGGIGVQAPRILAADPARGLLLVSDLGPHTYLDALAAGIPAAPLYDDALAALTTIQSALLPPTLPRYDGARLLTELRLFPEWFVDRHLGLAIEAAEQVRIEQAFSVLLASHLAQASVFVHRDFHCRNLMHTATANPGVLDFQGALLGPITYDLVSLLRDAYVEWDEEQQIDWAVRYWEQARRRNLPVGTDFGAFWRDLEWMGLQRHLKVLGLFARLAHRDGKPRYLADCPRVLGYARSVARRYDALAALARVLDRAFDHVPDRPAGAGLAS